ncbi:MAG: TetR/AcrR family transcriptional regulator [Gemmatimonadota bacterium]
MPKFLRRPESRPDELLIAALARFTEVGYTDARVEDVAAMAGVTVGTVYRYFPGKEALFQALIERYLDAGWSRGKEITEAYGTTTPREVLTLLLNRLAASLQEPAARDVLLLVVREAARFQAAVEAYVEQLLKKGCIAVERALRHGIDRGEFPLLPVELTARALVAGVLQQVIWEATFAERMGAPRDPMAQTELAIAMMIRGLPNPDSNPRPTLPTMRAATAPAPGHTGEIPIPGKVRIVTLRPPSAD